jgi:signal peptidase II
LPVRVPFSRWLLFLLVAGAGLAADLITKSAVFAAHWRPDDALTQHWWIDDILGIETSFNGGALFGWFQGGSWWLAGLSLVALTGILCWLFVLRMAASRFLTFSLALVTGGILGNLYDRMGFGFSEGFPEAYRYHVRDWIHFHVEGVAFLDPWPNFNIADSLLVTGAILLFVFALFSPEMHSRTRTGEE